MTEYCHWMILITTMASGGCTTEGTEQPLSVMTFNIRYDNPNDGVDAWENRSKWVTSIIHDSGVHVVGLQEALKHQIDDIVTEESRFRWIGVGRTDGISGGEYSPILYDPDRLELLDWHTKWLSEYPDSVGISGWDAALPRIATIASFVDRTSADTIRVINTHFDHRGEEAREKSAALIGGWSTNPSIVMGDFNIESTTPAYTSLTVTRGLNDAAVLTEMDSVGTFRTFDPAANVSRRIDYVFLTSGYRVLDYRVLSPLRNRRYPSDHLPVVARIAQ